MSFLTDAGNAVGDAGKTVADNAASKTLDDVAGGLGGAFAGPGAPPAGTAYYYEREELDPTLGKSRPADAQSDAGGSPPPPKPTNIGGAPPIEFIHFGKVHRDVSPNFDAEKPPVDGVKPPIRGIAFRDALVRETVLLHGFVRAAKLVLEENKKSKGAAGEALETVGSLLGGSSKASAGPEQFDAILKKVQEASAPINVPTVGYPDIHKAGMDLHKARASFAKLCESALKPGGGGGMSLPTLPPLAGKLGGAPDIVAKIPEWLFKVQDTYLAMFRAARAEYEQGIEEACRRLTIEAIKDGRAPSYAIWFTKEEAPTGNGAPTQGQKPAPNVTGTSAERDARQAAQDVEDTVDKAKQDATDAQNSLTDWLATDEAATRPGSGALAAALAVLGGGTLQLEPGRKRPITAAPKLMAAAFADGVGTPLPPIVQKVVEEMAGAGVEIVGQVLTNVLAQQGDGDFQGMVLLSTRQALSGKIVGLIWKLIGLPGAPGANKKQTAALGKVSVGQQELQNKAADLVQKFLTDQARHLDAVLDFVVEDLTKQLNEARKESKGSEALTMETYLGRLPMLVALMVRNTIFPVFNLLLEAFGLAGPVSGLVWNPVKDKIKEAGELATKAKGYKDNAVGAAKKVKEHAADLDKKKDELGNLNADAGDIISGKTDPFQKHKQFAKDAQGAKDDVIGTATRETKSTSTDDKPAPAGDGPLSAARKTDGTARKITKADVDQSPDAQPLCKE